MKYIYYSSVVFALLLSSCSRQVSLTKTTNSQPNTVAYKPIADTAIIRMISPKSIRAIGYTVNSKDFYEDAYARLKGMLEGKAPISFKNAVYITENAWFGNKLSYNAFDNYIKALAEASMAWKKANPLLNYNWEADSMNVALSGAIYHIMSDTVKDEKGNIVIIPYHYDFNDCSAHDHWTNMFVTKLMVTHGGNCHSLPFLYKMIAEELGTKAYLSFLPEHIYINQYSQKTSWYNTELTGKCFPVDAWLMTTGYVSVQSIRTGLYMDTLSLKQSIAVCVNDLAKGYQRKFNDTDYTFILKCCDLGLTSYPNYGELLLLKAETLKKLYQKDVELYGLNAPDSKEHGEELKGIYVDMEKTYNTLAKLDYREIPDALYNHWTQAMINGGKADNENIHDTVVTTNVYGAFGKKLDMIAVSNGKYVELFENDTLRRIGSVMFNNNTHKVEYFILKDDAKYSAQLNRSIEPSRFLSIDPLARQFPFYSPYQFAGNSPIAATDLDGRESFIATKDYSAKSPTIILTLVNAEDELSVTWAKQDEQTQTQPLQLAEVDKFVSDIKVDKDNKIITLPQSPTSNQQTIVYPEYAKDKDGNYTKDDKGNLIPIIDQKAGAQSQIESHVTPVTKIYVGGGSAVSNTSVPMTDQEMLNKLTTGTEPANKEYDAIEVFVSDPKLKPLVNAKLNELGFDMSKVKYVNTSKNKDEKLEVTYVKYVKTVSDIK